MLSADTNPPELMVGRDRAFAQRRGILMSLARERELYFQPRFFLTVVFSILTFGIGPLFQFAHKIHRWRRFETLELATASRELFEIVPRDETRALVRLVDDDSIRIQSNRLIYMVLLISIGISIHWLISIRSINALYLPIWKLSWDDSHRTALTISLMLAAIGLLASLSRHEKSVDRFYKSLNAWLLAREHRPLRIRRTSSGSSPLFLFVALLAIIAGLWWIAPACFVAAAMTRYARRISATHRLELGQLLVELKSNQISL